MHIAQAHIVLSGIPTLVAGTSVTAPVWAGLVARLNAAVRATPGLENRTMGFMNPFLYWAAQRYKDAYVDITLGDGFLYQPNGTRYLTWMNSADVTEN